MARISLTARWFGLLKWVKTIDDEFISKLYLGLGIPEYVHEFVKWKGVESHKISDIRMHHEGIPKLKVKRPTLKLYQSLNEWVREYEPREADILIICKDFPHDRTYKLSEIHYTDTLSFNINHLDACIEAFQAVYWPKSGHVKCNYCGKQTPSETALYATFPLTSVSGTYSKNYCTPICQTHDEWAHLPG